VRVVKVTRTPGRHELRDLTVDVGLEGDFEAAHLSGDNSALIATDTMRNVIYALARTHPLDSLESFGAALVDHFLRSGPTVERVAIDIAEHPWERLQSGAEPHEHAFQRGHGGTRLARVTGDASGVAYEAGIDDLLVLKTTASGWEGFVRDQHTTLPETDDRILSTMVTARWEYGEGADDFDATWFAVRETLLEAFGDHYSPSVQFTLNRMGEAALEHHPSLLRIHLSLPNRHHLLYDLSRFGVDNPNTVFHATTEPYGLIEGTIERRPQ
jgi:urate oxidase